MVKVGKRMTSTIRIAIFTLLTFCFSSVNASGEVTLSSIQNSLGKEMEVAIAGQGDRAVILAHQYKGSWKSWEFFIPALVAEGYKVYAFDFNGYGKNGGFSKKRMNNDLDIEKVIEFARADGASKVILIGSSMGAAAVLKAALTNDVDGIVAMAPYHKRGGKFANLGDGEAEKVNAPVYLFTARQDSSYKHAEELHSLLPTSELYVGKGKQHGYELLKTGQDQEVRQLLMEFLRSRFQ